MSDDNRLRVGDLLCWSSPLYSRMLLVLREPDVTSACVMFDRGASLWPVMVVDVDSSNRWLVGVRLMCVWPSVEVTIMSRAP